MNKIISKLFLGIFLIFFMGSVFAAISDITVTSPNGGELWSGTHAITWTATGCTGDENVNIYLGKGGIPSAPGSAGSIVYDINCALGTYSWNTDSRADGNDYVVIIKAKANESINDHSNDFFEIDNTKPTVISATASPDPAVEEEVTITVVFSEDMNTSVAPTITITGLKTTPYTVTQSSYATNTWIGTVTLNDSNEDTTGNISVTAAQDLATNVMDDNITAGTIHVDTLSPTLLSIAWADVDGSTAISATDTLTLTFSEAIDTNTITDDNVAIATDLGLSAGIFGATGFGIAWNTDNNVLTITLGAGTTIVSGATLNPAVTVTDVLGNGDATETPVAITDNVKPLVISATANPDPAVDEEVTITVVFSEDMNTSVAPTITITGLKTTPYTVTQSSYATNTWIGTVTLNDSNEDTTGNISVTAAQDLATNVMDDNITAGTIHVDTLSPTLLSIAWADVDGSTAISATDTLTLTFSEAIDTNTITDDNVAIATDLGLSAGIFGATGFGIAWNTDNNVLTITLGAGTTIVSGATLNPAVTVTDVLGNGDATETPVAITDNVKPLVISATANPDPAVDEEVTITVVFSEDMDTDVNAVVTLTNLAGNDYSVAGDWNNDTTWIGTVTLNDGNEDTTGSISVTTAQDLVGNVMVADTTAGTIHVDTLNPTLSSIVWADVDSSTAISATDTLTLTFNEAIDTSTITDDNIIIATDLGLSAGIFGATGFDIAWNTDNNVLTITLGAGTTIASGATLNPADTVTDVLGNIDATETPVAITDNVAPEVTYTIMSTTDQTPILTGTISEDANVEIEVDGKTYSNDFNAGIWEITVTDTLATGYYDVNVTATDLATNETKEEYTEGLSISEEAYAFYRPINQVPRYDTVIANYVLSYINGWNEIALVHLLDSSAGPEAQRFSSHDVNCAWVYSNGSWEAIAYANFDEWNFHDHDEEFVGYYVFDINYPISTGIKYIRHNSFAN